MSTVLLVELAKLGIQVFFQSLRMAGKTPEEIDMMFQEEKATFLANKPEDLPDV